MNIIFGFIIAIPVVLSDCPDGWIWNNAICYHFSSEKQPMASASYMCKVQGGHLVDIDDKTEGDYLAKVALFYGHTYWLGLNNLQYNTEWMWLHSMKTLNDTQYDNWYPGQPDTTDNTKHCVVMDTSRWLDAVCVDSYRYICEKSDPMV